MKIYEYVVYFIPTEGDKENQPTIVCDGKLLGSDEQSTLLKIGRLVPEYYLDKLDNLKVALRPFARPTAMSIDWSTTSHTAGLDNMVAYYGANLSNTNDTTIVSDLKDIVVK